MKESPRRGRQCPAGIQALRSNRHPSGTSPATRDVYEYAPVRSADLPEPLNLVAAISRLRFDHVAGRSVGTGGCSIEIFSDMAGVVVLTRRDAFYARTAPFGPSAKMAPSSLFPNPRMRSRRDFQIACEVSCRAQARKYPTCKCKMRPNIGSPASLVGSSASSILLPWDASSRGHLFIGLGGKNSEDRERAVQARSVVAANDMIRFPRSSDHWRSVNHRSTELQERSRSALGRFAGRWVILGSLLTSSLPAPAAR